MFLLRHPGRFGDFVVVIPGQSDLEFFYNPHHKPETCHFPYSLKYQKKKNNKNGNTKYN